ncbi:hypothetical protein LTR91_000420 [Friedmanniomyces endolithicus]|uniref:Uncharacterized protein n=1 Tax=Friedmanniomyces endolithicus TaxID=329885 RepID=A0AAN6JBE3_9PEZI|nr:hypothetical protein LTR35_010032 [Friedmanniomyces endolithicus]KAK0298250.1 hypothetical protein LTS00_003215 [Friedmanniomyces endolithicus]KAK0313672.1 hypothetical protein LTR01_001929 [Friedmanniomyces endolithicus]KAK0323868.1 hypothetical protein LTR82_004988 [Friedmanniomyces endolithicus]KAK0830463.1 hypothetical protein LTR73_003742 [Friedmanniomyces endolithicus]
MANDDNTSSPPRTSEQDPAQSATFAERLAHAAEEATQSTNRLSTLTDSHAMASETQTEINRRRAAHKTAYYAFAEAAEHRRQRVCSLMVRNACSNGLKKQNEKAIADGTGDVAALTAQNEEIRLGLRQLNRENAAVVDEAKRDIEVQRKWDAFYALRSDEPPGV